MSKDLIERVTSLVTSGSMSRAGLARAAGLHANTLRDCGEPGWNPTAETLGKLERFLLSNDDRRVLVPMFLATINSAGTVRVVSVTAPQFAAAPGIRNPEQVTLLEEDKICAYFGGGHFYATPERSEPLV